MAKSNSPLVGIVAPDVAVDNFKQKHGKKIIMIAATTAIVVITVAAHVHNVKKNAGL